MPSECSTTQTPPSAIPKRSKRSLGSLLGWTRSSYTLISIFFTVVALIIVVWWPLVEDYWAQVDPNYPLWYQLDWLLFGIFGVMSFLIMSKADLKTDIWIVMVGLGGGLVIESWGTQTNLWTYYTLERPPLWIIPAWPIASLSIDRLVRIFRAAAARVPDRCIRSLYWLLFVSFYGQMLYFVWPTIGKSLTWMALLTTAFLVATPTNYRTAVLTFIAGSALGYFLERWGTTRLCWNYYTLQTPPVFAVFAHGLAAVAFWRTKRLLTQFYTLVFRRLETA